MKLKLFLAGLLALGLTVPADAGRTRISVGYSDGYSSFHYSSGHSRSRHRADVRIDGSSRWDRRYRDHGYHHRPRVHYRPSCPPPVYYYRPPVHYRPVCPPPVYYSRPYYRSISYAAPSVSLGFGYSGSHTSVGVGFTLPVSYSEPAVVAPQPSYSQPAYQPADNVQYASTYSAPSRHVQTFSSVERSSDKTVNQSATLYKSRVVDSRREVVDNRPSGEAYQPNTYYKNNGRMDVLSVLRQQQEARDKAATQTPATEAPEAATPATDVQPAATGAVPATTRVLQANYRVVDLPGAGSVRTVPNRVGQASSAAPSRLAERWVDQQGPRVQHASLRTY
jgi:hypothetical protein